MNVCAVQAAAEGQWWKGNTKWTPPSSTSEPNHESKLWHRLRFQRLLLMQPLFLIHLFKSALFSSHQTPISSNHISPRIPKQANQLRFRVFYLGSRSSSRSNGTTATTSLLFSLPLALDFTVEKRVIWSGDDEGLVRAPLAAWRGVCVSAGASPSGALPFSLLNAWSCLSFFVLGEISMFSFCCVCVCVWLGLLVLISGDDLLGEWISIEVVRVVKVFDLL